MASHLSIVGIAAGPNGFAAWGTGWLHSSISRTGGTSPKPRTIAAPATDVTLASMPTTPAARIQVAAATPLISRRECMRGLYAASRTNAVRKCTGSPHAGSPCAALDGARAWRRSPSSVVPTISARVFGDILGCSYLRMVRATPAESRKAWTSNGGSGRGEEIGFWLTREADILARRWWAAARFGASRAATHSRVRLLRRSPAYAR